MHGSCKGQSEGPDKGWSWVVAFAAFCSSLVLAGIFRTSGVLFVAFIATFGVSREEAAWPLGVCISVLNLIGPVSGLLSQRYGVRPVVIAGAVIGAIGVSACYFSTSLTVITVLFGGIFGIGYGLVSTLLPVIVNVYFLEFRGTANGIANSGSCFGSVILPVLFEYLISNYGLSECFLLTGGIVLNVAVAGALMRPPSWKIPYPKLRTTSEDSLTNVTVQENSVSLLSPRKTSLSQNTSGVPDVPNLRRHSKREPFISSTEDGNRDGCGYLDPSSDPHGHLQAELLSTLNKRTTFQTTELTNFAEESYESLDTSASSVFERKNSTQDTFQIELHQAQKQFEDTLSDFQSVALDIVETSKSEEILNRLDTNETKTSDLTDSCPARHSFSVSSAKRASNRFKSQIPSSGPLKKYNFRLRNSSGDSDLSPVSENAYKEIDKSPERRTPLFKQAQEDVKSPELKKGPADKTDFETTEGKVAPSAFRSFATVLTSPMFYVTAITNVSFYFIFHMFVVVVVDYSLDQGVADEDTKYILFAFSMSDLFGRLCLGWITDRNFLTRSRFVMTGMVGIGVVFFALPFATDYWSLVVVSCCYGVLLGSTMVIFPILLVDFLGSDIHSVACGCMCFMNGFTSLIRPLIIGYFRDNVGSYHAMFFVLGIVSIVASAFWMLERCFRSKCCPSSQYEPMKAKG